MKKFIFILSAAGLLASCQSASYEEQLLDKYVDQGALAIDSAQVVIASITEQAFEEKEGMLAQLKEATRKLSPGSAAYDQAKQEYDEALKQFEEEKSSFLKEKKEKIKKLYEKANEVLAILDGEIGELNKTRKDPVVTTYAVAREVFKDYFTVKGNVESKYNAQLFAEIPGTVEKIFVSKGDQVSKGQAIMQINMDVLQKQMDEVDSNLSLANDLYHRQKNLWEKNIGSEVQYLEAKNRKESLENALATLQEQLSKATVRTPFAGIVDELHPKVGEMAVPGFPVARIVNLDELYIEADISENHFGEIHEGGEVLVSIQDIEGMVDIPATITRTGSYIKPDNRTFEIRVDFGNRPEHLIPNLVASLKINEFSTDSAETVLPYSMIQEDSKGNNFVWVLEKIENKENRWKVVKRDVETGNTYRGITHIRNGLAEGDVIIDKGARKVREDIAVRLEQAALTQINR